MNPKYEAAVEKRLSILKYLGFAVLRKTVILILLAVAQLPLRAQLTYENLHVDYDSAWQYKNLKVIPIRWKGAGNPGLPVTGETITLNEALQKGLARVSERGSASTENVHWLIIENLSHKNIFIPGGDIIAGGRQDRMITRDTIMLARESRMQVPVMCVEEGRWSDREKKFVYQKQANMHLRKVLDKSRNQVLIWREIFNELDKDKVKAATFSYLARNQDKKFAALEKEYWDHFQQRFKNSDSTVIGIVCVSGDKVIGCDIFAGTNLFYGQLQPMLLGYIDEAIVHGATITAPDAKVKAYMDELLRSEASQQAFIRERGKAFYHNGKIIHITTY
ncbi:MAG TPA: DUF6569 family protein [Chitinophagaceae bacterium]|nr:DUF6569 family protein [Chitinophagaceae bacterium]